MKAKQRRYVIYIFYAMLLMFFATSCTTGVKKTHVSKWSSKKIATERLPTFDIPIVVNDRVVTWIDYFQGPGRGHFARYMARSGRYIPMMQEILKKYALPQDLVYVALIESGFSSKAYSRARAAGFWQFIRSTGSRYGLGINHWIDERRDPERSTAAAARYLRDLFDEFGDWYLAMAAYNAGEGKIEAAIRRNGTRNFWEMIERDRRFLKAETKDYVPKFLAAAIIAKSPERFGFSNVIFEEPMQFETAKIDSQTDLEVVASCAATESAIVAELNPELIKGTTPPGASDYEVRLPIGTAKKFEVAYAELPASERVMVVRHTVKRKESIGAIARKYGVSVREILAANDLRSASSIKRGMSLVIPTGGVAKKRAEEVVVAESSHPKGRAINHRVQSGETLGLIAQDYGVNISSLKKWNRLKRDTIRAGQILKIYGGEEEVVVSASKNKDRSAVAYLIRRGDTWGGIARKYGVSIDELKQWNTNKKDVLIAGQRLELFASKKEGVNQSAVLSDKLFTPKDAASEPIMSEKKEMLASATVSSSDLLPMAENTTPQEKEISYKIQSGDTLWDIAKKYGVSTQDIIVWNNIVSHKRLKPGDVIRLRVE